MGTTRARRQGTRLGATIVAVLATVLVAAGCAPGPTPSLPDPLITCDVEGTISYTPAATGEPADTTLDALPGAAATDCTDGTGAGITGGELSISVLFPDFDCSPATAAFVGTELGSGSGEIEWSDSSTSTFTTTVRAGGLPGFSLELQITGGRWHGARASFVMQGITSTGSCTPADPLSTLTLASNGPFVLHPAASPLFGPRTDVVQVSAGEGNYSCAVLANGTARCWGADSEGELGNLLFAPGANALIPVEVTGLTGATQVSAGGDHTCALVTGGEARCWGSNERGQLGVGTSLPGSRLPKPVDGLSGATHVEVGYRHSCALMGDGTVRCWGANDAGQLGDGSNVDRRAPVEVAGISTAVQIDLGAHHSCARLAGGSVQCWGANESAQLGIGDLQPRNTPVGVFGVIFATDIAAGGSHTCAVGPSGSPQCWGWNRFGQLGIGTADDTPVPMPTTVQGGLGAVDLSAGGVHTCARLLEDAVACWGGNPGGQLGEGTKVGSPRPRIVHGLRDALQISAGGHTCAVRPGGRAECWGPNNDGQLGDGTTTDRTLPTPVVAP